MSSIMKRPRKTEARCNWCRKNKRLKAMAIFSHKALLGFATGVCSQCLTEPGVEKREEEYLSRGAKNIKSRRPIHK